MRRFDPDYVGDRFAEVSHGYLAADVKGLEARAQALSRLMAGRTPSVREAAIMAAIQWGIRSPGLWLRMQRPLNLERTPEQVFALQAKFIPKFAEVGAQ